MSMPLSRRYFGGAAALAADAQLGTGAPNRKPAPSPAGSPGARTYDIRSYGASGDGTTLDTAAVQAAIDACAHDRGGAVLVPAGDFLIGTIQLKSNVTLHLSASSRLLGSGNPDHY